MASASFRRAPSPAYHPSGINFSEPFTIQSPSHKLHPSSSSLLSHPLILLKRFLSWIFNHRYTKKGNQVWRFYFLRFLFCFAFGFLLGLLPFNHHHLVLVVDDDDNVNINMKPQDFKFELKKPPPVVNVQQDLTRFITRENMVLDTVSLGAVDSKMDLDLGLPRKQLIVVTPTYNRAMQAYFLHRLSQALSLVGQPLLWIVVEMKGLSLETSEILRKSGVMYRHLVCNNNSTDVKDRGVHQRNTALEHIEQHKLDGVVYFADDDNVYSLELFQSLRGISRFGTWPVAMLAPSKNKAILEGPVCNGSQVIGWHTNEKSKRLRRFHVDMSGFAFNSTILWDPKRWHRPTSIPIRQRDTVKEGFQETTFIEQVVEDESQMEATPNNCLRILNWHLHLEARSFVYPRKWELQKNLDDVVSID